MESLPSYITDTTDFINKIRQLPQLSKDSFLVTLDVKSLYSNILQKDCIEACQYFMNNGCKANESFPCISKLIELGLTKIIFSLKMLITLKNLVPLWVLVWLLLMLHCFW